MHQHISKSEDILVSNRIGAWMSIACAIHCALMPLAFSMLPLLGLEFLASHWLEVVLLSAGLGFGTYGILRAYFRQHRDPLPVLILAAGASLVLMGLFILPHELEHVAVPVGALLVGAAQVVNIRKSRVCKTC